jgi:hypothetical protein
VGLLLPHPQIHCSTPSGDSCWATKSSSVTVDCILERRVNSKKPPYSCLKYLKPPQFGQITQNHQYWGNLLQCALIVQFLQANTISDRYGPLSGLMWQSETDDFGQPLAGR